MNSPRDGSKKRQRTPIPATQIEDAVSDRLRSFYSGIADQEVPQHLLDLLDQLDQAGAQQPQPIVKK